MKPRTAILATIGLLVIAGAEPVRATTVECPDFSATVFATAAFSVPARDLPTLRRRLGEQAPKGGLEVYDVDVQSQQTQRPALWVVMVPRSGGGRLEVKASEPTGEVILRVTNDCRHATVEWRPHWQSLLGELSDWGYQQTR